MSRLNCPLEQRCWPFYSQRAGVKDWGRGRGESEGVGRVDRCGLTKNICALGSVTCPAACARWRGWSWVTGLQHAQQNYHDAVLVLKKKLIFLECSVSTFNLFLEKIKYCLTSVAQAAAADLYNADKEFKD